MKRFLFFLAMAVAFISASAQDVIVKKNGDEIQALVTKIGNSEIEYKKWSNQNGPAYTISKGDVFMIKYKNGDKEVIDQTQTAAPQSQQVVVANPYGNFSQSMYKFDEKQNLLDKAERATSAAKTFDWIAMPLGIVVGIGGTFLFDEGNMIWVGLGLEVASLITSSCLHAKASRLTRKASLYHGWESKPIRLGNSNLHASAGVLDNGRVGVVLDF